MKPRRIWRLTFFVLLAAGLITIAVLAFWWNSGDQAPTQSVTVSRGDVVDSIVLEDTTLTPHYIDLQTDTEGTIDWLQEEGPVEADALLARITQPNSQSVNISYWQRRINDKENQIYRAQKDYFKSPANSQAVYWQQLLTERESLIDRFNTQMNRSRPNESQEVAAPHSGELIQVAQDTVDKNQLIGRIFRGWRLGEDIDLGSDLKSDEGRVIFQTDNQHFSGSINSLEDSIISLNNFNGREPLTGRLELVSQVVSDVVSIPRTALRGEHGDYWVEVVDSGQRSIDVGLIGNQFVEVTAGLETGERVRVFE